MKPIVKQVDGEWRPVVGYEGFYEVSDLGHVRRVARSKGTWPGRVLKRTPNNHGYPRVTLFKRGAGKTALVHRLVLEAFVGPCPEGLEARHLDGDPLNSGLENLVWGTSAENEQDKLAHGTSNHGERCGTSKLTETQVLEIHSLASAEELTQFEIAAAYGIAQQTVSEIKLGVRWGWLTGSLGSAP